MNRVFTFALCVLLAVFVGACGGDTTPGDNLEAIETHATNDGDEKQETHGTVTNAGTTEEESEDLEGPEDDAAPDEGEGAGDGDADHGKELFTAQCAACHTLADAGATGTVGPNLDEVDLDADSVSKQIDEGGGSMPADIVEGQDRDDVATYVAEAAGK